MSAWEAVEAAIDAGDHRLVAARVLELDDEGRRQVAAALPGHIPVARSRAEARAEERRLRRERKAEQAWQEHRLAASKKGRELGDHDRWQWEFKQGWYWDPVRGEDNGWIHAMRVAGAGALGGPAAVVSWLNRRDFRLWRSRVDLVPVLERVLAARPHEWQSDFAVRAARRLRGARGPARAGDAAPLALAMLRRTGATPPEHDPLVVAWVTEPGAAERLHDDPLLDHLLPRLFEAEGVGRALRDERADRPDEGNLLTALRRLAGSGRVSRDLLLDGCVRRFLRGGAAPDLRFFVRLHELLEPAPDEVAGRARDYLRLLPAAPGPVAETALRRLRGIGPLDPADSVEAVQSLLVRAERKLVTAGLTWLDRLAKETPGDLDELAPALAYAFACESADVQGRAVRLAVKHARRFTPAGAKAVRDTIGMLPQDLRETLASVYGGAEPGDAPWEAEAYDGFEPAPLPVPVATRPLPAPVTRAEQLSDTSWHGEADRWERWLAGFVRLCATDPAGLREALARLLREPAHLHGRRTWSHPSQWAEAMAREAVAPGAEPPAEEGGPRAVPSLPEAPAASWERPVPAHPRMPGADRISTPHLLLLSRWAEAYVALQAGALPPYLLAEPTSGTGHLDPAVLVERLAGYERAGAEPMPADLQQALLRLPRDVPAEVAAAAAALPSAAGQAAARWMAGGRPRPVSGVRWADGSGDAPDGGRHGGGPHADAGNGAVPAIGAEPTGLGLVDALFSDPGPRRWDEHGCCASMWPGLLPSDRETVALHLVPHLGDQWGSGNVTPDDAQALLRCEGPAGDGVALVLASFLGRRAWDGDLAPGTKLLLDLAARGGLPAERVGAQLAAQLRRSWQKLGPVLASLEGAALNGAHREVWEVLTGFLPGYLPGPGERPHSGHTQALAFALRAARWAGARGTLPCVSEPAARKASSNYVREARRLHAYLS
uniref:DUF7824 domain-containing protein n=1 Tax=Nonomuraea pusilla TaxID=46177 RepID=UPI0006E35DAD|nr:DUF6493 family protein [Nonomuraea pusilla]